MFIGPGTPPLAGGAVAHVSAMSSLYQSFILALCALTTLRGAEGVAPASAAPASAPLPAVPVPVGLFQVAEGLEITQWAASPLFQNPTNIDIDEAGRLWVAEGVNYRGHSERRPEGDRIMVLEDTDHDGTADKSWCFVQEPFLHAPLGVAVVGNQVIVSMAPDLIVYTDVDGDLKFDPAKDRREVRLTGFNGRSHDHSLHSVKIGPDGQWYFSAGNCGAKFTDGSGQQFVIGSAYDPTYGKKKEGELGWLPTKIAGTRSSDGNVYIGGFAARMQPDGSLVKIIGQNFRNSFEQAITSLGDVFQNDNDDSAGCRTAWLMPRGNAGFCSTDGKRSWQADQRPGQDVPTAEWRQEDPGVMPAGDVYGGGAPCGLAFYENGALPQTWSGTLLSCEAARNTVFAYRPKAQGAGFTLERTDLITTNPTGEFAGTDFKGGAKGVTKETKTLFRPSDIAVGPDGALYVSDWFDPRVGGHADMDSSLSGTIYRIAPKGFKSVVPTFDLKTPEGALTALRSPALHTRESGRRALQQMGSAATESVATLLKDPSLWIQGRALFLLPQLGIKGQTLVESITATSEQPEVRLAAFRSLQRRMEKLTASAAKADRLTLEGLAADGERFFTLALRLLADPAPAIRAEIMTSFHGIPPHIFTRFKAPLIQAAQTYDGQDRWYLEAFGLACAGNEPAAYAMLLPVLGDEDPLAWTPAFAQLAWRLHPPAATAGFKARALSDRISPADQKAAVTALGFQPEAAAALAMVEIAAAHPTGPLGETARWWLQARKGTQWKAHDLDTVMKAKGLANESNAPLTAIQLPTATANPLPPVAEIAQLTPDIAKGAITAQRCLMCHQINGAGVAFGPELTTWGRTQPLEVVIRSIAEPSAEIASGFAGRRLITTEGLTIDGLVVSEGDPTTLRSMGGTTQRVPQSKIKELKPLERSLMLSATEQGLTAQDVADVAAWLKSL
jgi:putative membrane-bound dehydrogenase-like protein